MAEAAIAGLAGGYGNIGYMGPGLALATLGAQAAAPVALIFCFDNILVFSLVPFLMGLAGADKKSIGATALDVAKKILLHPFIIATVLGVASAALHFEPPVALDRLMQFLQNAAAPCALFALGVTVALRPMARIPWDVPTVVGVKLILHPMLALVLAVAARTVQRGVGLYRRADGGVAAGAQRLHHGAPIRHLGRAGLELDPARNAHLGRDADIRHVARENPSIAAQAVLRQIPCRSRSQVFWFSISRRCCRGRWRP